MSVSPSFSVNTTTISFVAGLIGLAGVGITVVSYFKAIEAKNVQQDLRLDRTDEDRANNTKALQEQTSEAQKLKEDVVRLTTVMEQNTITKKAENVYPVAYPSMARTAANLEVQ